jgi:hypothetical protein
LRSALVEEPRTGVLALAALGPSELTAVMTALGPSEARRVLETVAAIESGGDFHEAAARALTPLVTEWLPLAAALSSPWLAALALVARAARALSPAELPATAALAAAVAGFLDGQVRHFDAPDPSALLKLSPAARRELLAPLGAAAQKEPEAPPAGWYTRCGGLLLLLPRLAELPLDELFGEGAGCARLVLLSRAAGPPRRAEVLADPLWRRLCGVAPDADVDEWLRTAPIVATLPAALWRRGLRCAGAVRLKVARGLVAVAAEPGGDWVALAPLTPSLRAALRSPALEIDGLEVAADITPTAARSTARMLAWLLPDSDVELALALAAQQVLRAFARRLPGFAESTPRFLYDSFLDFDATVIESDGTFHCRVGRPRLAALFGLTGALRGRLPISDGRALELHPEG